MYKNNYFSIISIQFLLIVVVVTLSFFVHQAFTSAQAPLPLPAVSNFIFSYDLKLGSRGEAVLRLQQILNSDPETLVSLEGPGSKGGETDYFGPATHSAVIRFQEKYRGEILLSVGLSRGTGFVGSLTRAKLNNLTAPLASTPIFTPIVSSMPVITKISPISGPNGTKITITGENFAAKNTVITTLKKFENIPSKDGKTIKFTFNNPPFEELQRIKDRNGRIDDIDIPFYINVENKNGLSNSPIIFTIQIR